ncbi:hypothetical protein SOCE26_003890 [Sorangium cellulosum]|uniref:Secreted protein n=1 Tax=Sorangium cellulosum TaxID=56 RepID=A0A2L0EI94_SORCE|nr:hypothetical protein [Sorangium cellulosum]AUX39007.1 hypothetical protein SOCE26_003890 [Sorangium cellulosum]
MRVFVRLLVALAFPLAACSGPPARGTGGLRGGAPEPPPPPAPDPPQQPAPAATPAAGVRWRLVHHETFDTPFQEPAAWTEDTYGPASPYHVDAFDDDGAFFITRAGETFRQGLRRFRSFRKSFSYGEGGWLTVELYGRDSDRDGVPETGGRFEAAGGKARLVSARHYDGAILRSTRPLPARYRVEVTVSNIDFGGPREGRWRHGGKVNGYDGDELADPWRFSNESTTPLSATFGNGVYFLCITDYARPAPHNNVLIHHHRKVVMDTDNNFGDTGPWSAVWDPATGRPEQDGARYVSMIWLRGDAFGSPWNGNRFTSYTPGGWQDGPIFVDKYLDREAYVFTVERDGRGYAMSAAGTFHHGGRTTYAARRGFREPPVTWHYNQRPDEYEAPRHNETVTFGETFETWPEGSAYPDHFFFGDPHINYYEGTAEFDDLKLYLPEEEGAPEGLP